MNEEIKLTQEIQAAKTEYERLKESKAPYLQIRAARDRYWRTIERRTIGVNNSYCCEDC